MQTAPIVIHNTTQRHLFLDTIFMNVGRLKPYNFFYSVCANPMEIKKKKKTKKRWHIQRYQYKLFHICIDVGPYICYCCCCNSFQMPFPLLYYFSFSFYSPFIPDWCCGNSPTLYFDINSFLLHIFPHLFRLHSHISKMPSAHCNRRDVVQYNKYYALCINLCLTNTFMSNGI